MTCNGCRADIDGVEVSHIQQRAVLRDLHRALVDPELDGVVLARATKSEQWMEGYDSAVELVDTRVEHLTGHIEGLADAVPPVPRTQLDVDRDVFDLVTDAWAMWCDETSVQDAEMSDGERAGFKVAATHMRDPRLRGLIRSTVPSRATDPAAGGNLAARDVRTLRMLAARMLDGDPIEDADRVEIARDVVELTDRLAAAPASEAETEGGEKPGAWITETVARARERFDRLPPGARPVVTRPATPREQGTAEATTEGDPIELDEIDDWTSGTFADADGWYVTGAAWGEGEPTVILRVERGGKAAAEWVQERLLAATPRAEGEAAAVVRDLVDPQASHRAVLDAFAYAARPGVADDPQSMGWWAARAILDLQTSRRCAPPAPEVVSGPSWPDGGGLGHPDVARIAALVARLPEQIDHGEIDVAKRSISRVYDWVSDQRYTPRTEVVSGTEAASLTPASQVVDLDVNDVPYPGSPVRVISGTAADVAFLVSTSHYLVVHRATEPAASLAVGDEVSSAEQLDTLPCYAGVRSDGGQCVRYERLLDGQWYCAGDTRAKKPGQVLAYGAHVSDLPEAGA